MNSIAVIALFAVLACASSTTVKTKVTPVQKVIQLMEGMKQKGKDEMNKEQVQFAAYKQFCQGTTEDKTKAIADAENMIVKLKADIQKFNADAEALGLEIAAHDEDIAVWEGDVKSATKVREIELADYTATHKDYSESIDALDRAMTVLKKTSADKAQASAALLELQSVTALSSLMSNEQQKVMDAFLQTSTEEKDADLLAAPQANAYEFQSQGVVDMLEKLQDKFTEERKVLENEETESKHAYDMLMQDLENSISDATEQREDKSKTKSQKLQAAADATGDLTDTTTTMEDDKKYLEDLVSTCEIKAGDFATRQALRKEELEAIQKAIDIIASQSVSGASEEHLPQLIQTSAAGASLAQLRPGAVTSAVQKRVAFFLEGRAKELNSRLLSALAVRVTADPFKKIKKMIKDLIVKLLEEANEEATHKGWCDTELGKNEHTRNKKTETVEILHAEIDQLEASIAHLGQELSDLAAAVAELDAAAAKATAIREEEKAKNTNTISDAKEAQVAVDQALAVLKEFYAKAAESTALVQQQPEAPEVFDEPYKGMGGEAGGVTGMLEVILSDFANLETKTTMAEEQAQKEYDDFMQDTAMDKAQKEKDIEHKTAKKQNQEQVLTEKQSDLEGTQKELDAAMDYYEKLKPDCVDEAVSYEDRVARRKEEIQSLQDALQILNESTQR